MKKTIVTMVALSFAYAQAQTTRYPINIYWLSAGQYGDNLSMPASFAANPAAFPSTPGFSASVYSEKKFMTEGLSFLAFSSVFTFSRGAAGLNMQYFGNPEFNELQAGVNYGKSLGKVNIGAAVNYNSMAVAGFEKQAVINFSLATAWQISENIYTGLQIINPRISRSEQMRTASSYRLGFGCRHSDKVYTGFEFFKEEDRPAQIFAALYYHVNERIFVRGGFISGASQLFLGAGWRWKDFSIEVISWQHAALGLSPSVLFTYQKNPRK